MAEPLIAIEGVTMRRAGVPVIRGLSLTMERPGVLGLIGPNGAGKSTLLAGVAGWLAYEGSIKVAGAEAAADVFAARRRARAAVPPGAVNDALTGEAYAGFLRAHRKAAFRDGFFRRAAAALSLEDALGRPIGAYSLGMRMKLGLLCALSFEAEVYLLDEILNGLDQKSLRAAERLIAAEAEAGRGVVLASHAVAQLHGWCDEVAVMDRGRIASTMPGARRGGSLDELMAVLDEVSGFG